MHAKAARQLRRISLIVVGLLVLASIPLARATGDPGPGVDRIDRLVSRYARIQGYPGIVVAITKDDRVLRLRGYGHDSVGQSITPTTRMPIASVSKTITAAAVLQLVERGSIELDAPVGRYLRGFSTADRLETKITVRELLEQTSGITDRTLAEKSLPQPHSLAGAEQRASAMTAGERPGAKYAYTNTNFQLAARIVEVVSGMDFADYLQRQLFAPIGMGDSTSIVRTPEDLPTDVARGHGYAYGLRIPITEPVRFVAGSDGVITTAADLAKWLIMEQNGGRTTGGGAVLSPESVAAMHAAPKPGASYGMGWEINGDRVGHDGIWFTYTAGVRLLPSGYAIAVIGNSGLGLGNEGIGELADSIGDVLEGSDPAPVQPIRPGLDLILAALALATLALGVRRVVRVQAWVDKYGTRPGWRLVIRLAPRLLPLLVLIFLPDLLAYVAAGRDITLLQACYAAPALVLWIGLAAVLNAVTLIARTAVITSRRRAGSTT